MSSGLRAASYYVGWDVGGWNCDKNGKSRDALVILDAGLAIMGKPWRGNLRTAINEATTTGGWIATLFALCAADRPDDGAKVTLAIDTPLGFSGAFVRLVTGLECAGPVGSSETNPYLFRQTEHFLFQRGVKPLSAIKDMIGSQATKGIHVLAKFAPRVTSCGVWTDGAALTAIEAYPSGCKGSATIERLRSRYTPLGHEDEEDALTCALIGYLFAEQRAALAGPPDTVPASEGWIWIPRDAVGQ
ncbi:MAG: hypothetical protein AB1649_00220 [Chloroflexota bacterium]